MEEPPEYVPLPSKAASICKGDIETVKRAFPNLPPYEALVLALLYEWRTAEKTWLLLTQRAGAKSPYTDEAWRRMCRINDVLGGHASDMRDQFLAMCRTGRKSK